MLRKAGLLAVGAVAAGFLIGGCGKKEAPAPKTEPTPSAPVETQQPAGNDVTPPQAAAPEKKDETTAEPNRIVIHWSDKFVYAQAAQFLIGSPLAPHVMGKAQFFAGDQQVQGGGTLIVDMFDPDENKPAETAVPKMSIVIEPKNWPAFRNTSGPLETLDYTVIFPWGWDDMPPNQHRARLNVRFKPAKGDEMHLSNEVMTFQAENPAPTPARAE
jgi:hypothetical protein